MARPTAFPVQIKKVHVDSTENQTDLLAVEEPLEIRLGFGTEENRDQRSLAITMRTPGNDLELALGFLYTEGIIQGMQDTFHFGYCKDNKGKRSENIVRIEIQPSITLDWSMLQRNFYTSSSCGICGKTSIESLESICPTPVESTFQVTSELICSLSDKMRQEQLIFEHTGGLHASALFDSDGNLLFMCEDIGRHNALDKVIGTALFKEMIPLRNHIVVLSGRSCFELIQKSVMAGISVIVSVGAPSSLAVKAAEEFGVTLIGFSRNKTFNVYSGSHRLM